MAQTILRLDSHSLVPKVLQFKHEGYRLVQISCTRLPEDYEITYSFAKDYELINLRLVIDENTEIISISDIYEPAFLYENEIHDLFGVKINLISLDYQGNLYRTAEKTPFK